MTMPLAMSREGELMRVVACYASGKVRAHLDDLGILPGQQIAVISSKDGDLILAVHDARFAINRGMANCIMVESAGLEPAPPEAASIVQGHHEQEHGSGLGLHGKRPAPGAAKRREVSLDQ